MIVVDTNVISEAMREKGDSRVIAWIDAQAVESLYLSAITVAELRFGILALPSGKRRDGLWERLERDVLPMFAGRVLPFDLAASESYAHMMAQARRDGRAVGKSDAYIAATALAHGFAAATRDVSPFEAVGVTVIDPWALG